MVELSLLLIQLAQPHLRRRRLQQPEPPARSRTAGGGQGFSDGDAGKECVQHVVPRERMTRLLVDKFGGVHDGRALHRGAAAARQR